MTTASFVHVLLPKSSNKVLRWALFMEQTLGFVPVRKYLVHKFLVVFIKMLSKDLVRLKNDVV